MEANKCDVIKFIVIESFWALIFSIIYGFLYVSLFLYVIIHGVSIVLYNKKIFFSHFIFFGVNTIFLTMYYGTVFSEGGSFIVRVTLLTPLGVAMLLSAIFMFLSLFVASITKLIVTLIEQKKKKNVLKNPDQT